MMGLGTLLTAPAVVSSVDQQTDHSQNSTLPNRGCMSPLLRRCDLVRRADVLVFPGAWALGDGLYIEADVYLEDPREEQHELASSLKDTEAFGAKALRLAGSFGENLRFYISEYPSPGPKAASPLPKDKEGLAGAVVCVSGSALGTGAEPAPVSSAEGKVHTQRTWFGGAVSKKHD